MGLAVTIIGAFALDYVGRRSCFLFAVAATWCCLITIGGLGLAPKPTSTAVNKFTLFVALMWRAVSTLLGDLGRLDRLASAPRPQASPLPVASASVSSLAHRCHTCSRPSTPTGALRRASSVSHRGLDSAELNSRGCLRPADDLHLVHHAGHFTEDSSRTRRDV
jgi:hypothetical protein